MPLDLTIIFYRTNRDNSNRIIPDNKRANALILPLGDYVSNTLKRYGLGYVGRKWVELEEEELGSLENYGELVASE